MSIRTAFLSLLITGTACSAQPQQVPAATATRHAAPVPRTLPDDAPDATVRNIAATTGKANLRQTPPPFAVTKIGQFADPFAMAFLPDGALLVSEKAGTLRLRRTDGTVVTVGGVPAVAKVDQGGLLDVAIAPDFASSRMVYLTYSEDDANGSGLTLARGILTTVQPQCVRAPCPALVRLEQVAVLWRSGMNGPGGQFGANIAFAPNGQSLFLSSGERQRFTPAQDPAQQLGKILHLTLDGKPAPGASGGGGANGIWSSGHRNPYGLVFDGGGRLWEVEMGPRGGDELNLILPGRNYGWPVVSNGDNYSGKPIPDHPSRPDLEAPKLWWNPSISPGGMMLYSGGMFPAYRGNLFIAGLGDESLIRVTLSGDSARAANQWRMGTRIRDVAQAPDGAIWLLEDGGALVRLTPK